MSTLDLDAELATPRSRWSWGLLGGVLGGALAFADTLMLGRLGVRFESGEARDVTVLVAAVFAVSLAGLGALAGRVAELRRVERAGADRLGRLERRLREADRLASLGQLASAIAHEVRNPLAVVRSWVQNLSEELPPALAEARSTCRLVLEEVDRLTHVTTTLVAFARPLPIARGRVPVAAVLTRARTLAERMWPEPLTVSAEGLERVEVRADLDLLCQLVLGLVANARAVAGATSPVALEGRRVDGAVELAVVDRGPGVPVELRERIFEPFFTTRPDGTGLGLAVARQIAEAHEATLRVEDRPGGGARFVLRLAAEEAT